jgi:hypothetical protein
MVRQYHVGAVQRGRAPQLAKGGSAHAGHDPVQQGVAQPQEAHMMGLGESGEILGGSSQHVTVI